MIHRVKPGLSRSRRLRKRVGRGLRLRNLSNLELPEPIDDLSMIEDIK